MHYIKSRLIYIILFAITIIVGLFSRSTYIPQVIYPYIGDVFYALMMYWIFAGIFPVKKPAKVALIAIGICFCIELLQLYQADWINAIRHTKLGGLVLGFGFLWSDLLCYTIGGTIGGGSDYFIKKRRLK